MYKQTRATLPAAVQSQRLLAAHPRTTACKNTAITQMSLGIDREYNHVWPARLRPHPFQPAVPIITSLQVCKYASLQVLRSKTPTSTAHCLKGSLSSEQRQWWHGTGTAQSYSWKGDVGPCGCAQTRKSATHIPTPTPTPPTPAQHCAHIRTLFVRLHRRTRQRRQTCLHRHVYKGTRVYTGMHVNTGTCVYTGPRVYTGTRVFTQACLNRHARSSDLDEETWMKKKKKSKRTESRCQARDAR
jgi:hypothetical protein